MYYIARLSCHYISTKDFKYAFIYNMVTTRITCTYMHYAVMHNMSILYMLYFSVKYLTNIKYLLLFFCLKVSIFFQL